MKKFYLLVLIYLFINISAYSAKAAERVANVYPGVIETQAKSLELNYEVLTPKPCFKGNPLVVRLFVRNPLSRDVQNVKVAFQEENTYLYELSALDENSGFDSTVPLWNVGTILAGETKTVDIKIDASISYVGLGVYVSSVDSLKWISYNYASTQVEINKELKVNTDTFYMTTLEYCGSTEPDTLDFATYWGVDKNIIKFYEDPERQKEVIGVDRSEAMPMGGKRYYVVFIDEDGCESDVLDFNVKKHNVPRVVIAQPEDTILSNANGVTENRVKVNYKIEGDDAPYSIRYEYFYFDDPNYKYEEEVRVDSNEGKFDIYPTASTEYKVDYVYGKHYCYAKQETPAFRIYTPKTKNYYLSTYFDYKNLGEDYVVSFYDKDAEFDTYQWQVSYDDGKTFEDLIDTVSPEDTVNVVSGAKTTELKISNLGPQSHIIRYRIKLLNSALPSFVYYSNPSFVRMQSYEGLTLRVLSDYLFTDYYCENQKVELICELSNFTAEYKKNLKVKLGISDYLDELTVTPSVGEYDATTKIWSIDNLDEYGVANILVSFNTKEDEDVTFSLMDVEDADSKNLSSSVKVNVAKIPVIGELKAPEVICERGRLSVEVPLVQSETRVLGTCWKLDGNAIGINASLSKEQNGAILEYEVTNMCGSATSNGVTIEVKGAPRIAELAIREITICEGESIELSAPEVFANGNIIKSEGWLLDGKPYVECTPIASNTKGFYELTYEVEGECGGKQETWIYPINVNQTALISEIKEPGPICDNSSLVLYAPMYYLRGASVESTKWILDGEEYVDEPVSYEKNGAKLCYEIVQSCGSSEVVVRTNEVEITVLPPVDIADIPQVYEIKKGEFLELQAPEVEYGVEPSDIIKYQTKWSLLDEYETVIIDDYSGEPISEEQEGLQLIYEVRPVIYFSPESHFVCSSQYSNVAQILFNTLTSIPVVEAENDESILPTAITPYNQNGLNDVFAEGMHVMIFDNRYQQIFEGDNGWDGTANMGWGSKNAIQPPGVYYYSVVLPSGEKKAGIVEIVRM